jgi:hypothetical protein
MAKGSPYKIPGSRAAGTSGANKNPSASRQSFGTAGASEGPAIGAISARSIQSTRRPVPPGSLGHHSQALPAIWENPSAFKDEQRLHGATESLIATAAEGDKGKLAASLKEVQEACNSCHFRLREQ